MSQTMIHFRDVNKSFKRQSALNNFNLNVPEGTIYGLVGRNGAGKSTTLRLVMNLLRADSGELQVMGHTPHQLPLNLRQQMGYSSDSLPLIPWLKVGQLLQENGAFYPDWDVDYVKLWLKRLELDIEKRIFSLSRGEKQKLAFLMAIGHRPRLLILDEPAGGLDPVVRQQFLESLIELLNETGTTIVLSSHQLQELERIAEYIGIVENGRMVLETELETLRSQVRRVVLMGDHSLRFQPAEEALLECVERPGYLELVYRDWQEQQAEILAERYPKSSLQVQALSLEDIFVLLQKKELSHV
jgi:ABC-2 type transport system ATP-binding protein